MFNRIRETELNLQEAFLLRKEVITDILTVLEELQNTSIDTTTDLFGSEVDWSDKKDILDRLLQKFAAWNEVMTDETNSYEIDAAAEASSIAQHDAISHLMWPVANAQTGLQIIKMGGTVPDSWKNKVTIEFFQEYLNSFIYYYYCLELCRNNQPIPIEILENTFPADIRKNLRIHSNIGELRIKVEAFTAMRTLMLNALQAVNRDGLPKGISTTVDMSIQQSSGIIKVVLFNDIVDADKKFIEITIASAPKSDTHDPKGGLRLAIKIFEKLSLKPNEEEFEWGFIEDQRQGILGFETRITLKV